MLSTTTIIKRSTKTHQQPQQRITTKQSNPSSQNTPQTISNDPVPLRKISERPKTNYCQQQSIHNDPVPPTKISQQSSTTNYHHKTMHNVPLPPREISQHPTRTQYYHQTIHNGPLPLALFRCNFNRCELLCNFIIT